jgi:rod shape-determining protein MreC
MRIRDFFLFRRYTLYAVILLLLTAVVLMSLRVKERKGVNFMDALLLEICSPFQKASTFVVQEIQETFKKYLILGHLREENEMLKKRIADLQMENYQMKETVMSSERLQRLLQFREKIAPAMIAAEVIGQDPTSWFKSITINKGERDGIRKGMAVISPEGVIGQILKTSPRHSVVLLITDYNSAIDAIVRRTRAKAIVEGRGENRCLLKYLLRAEDVMVGDRVVTSGLSGNFPKGMMIGEIEKVDKKGLGIFQHAELVPSANFTKLEEVLIIKEFPLPPQEEKRKEEQGKKAKGKK